MKETETKKAQWEAAKKYVEKVGAAQHHFRDGSVGKLCSCTVGTKISHQAHPSATNYWEDKHFDEYLSKVIEAVFKQLAERALELMYEDYVSSLVSEHDALVERLALIEELKKDLT